MSSGRVRMFLLPFPWPVFSVASYSSRTRCALRVFYVRACVRAWVSRMTFRSRSRVGGDLFFCFLQGSGHFSGGLRARVSLSRASFRRAPPLCLIHTRRIAGIYTQLKLFFFSTQKKSTGKVGVGFLFFFLSEALFFFPCAVSLCDYQKQLFFMLLWFRTCLWSSSPLKETRESH